MFSVAGCEELAFDRTAIGDGVADAGAAACGPAKDIAPRAVWRPTEVAGVNPNSGLEAVRAPMLRFSSGLFRPSCFAIPSTLRLFVVDSLPTAPALETAPGCGIWTCAASGFDGTACAGGAVAGTGEGICSRRAVVTVPVW